MSETAKQLVVTSRDIKNRSSAVVEASEETINNINTAASAAEELSSSVQEISRQISKATEISQEAVKAAVQGETAISTLVAASKKILMLSV